MRCTRFFVLFVVFVSSSASVEAQEDNWWRKLFRKEVGTDAQDEGTPKTDSEPVRVDTFETTTPEIIGIAIDGHTDHTSFNNLPGLVHIELPTKMLALDSLYRETPPAQRGFRIQVYFGDLASARERRKTCMEELPNFPCYLVQNPPNFAVMLGDYRTHLDAYRAAQTITDLYPAATIVPSLIEPPVLFRSEQFAE